VRCCAIILINELIGDSRSGYEMQYRLVSLVTVH
jgi:hypothetical protein